MLGFKQAFKNKYYEECLKEVEKLLCINPLSIQPMIFKSLSLYELGRYLQSYHAIQNLLKTDHQLNYKQKSYITEIREKSLREATRKIFPDKKHSFMLGEREITFPRNMGWVIPGQIVGSAMPKRKEQIRGFEEYNIKTVINMMDEDEVDTSIYDNSSIAHHIFGIPNRTAPSVAMMDTIMDIMEDTVALGGTVLVHCGGGVGRAGTVLACYILKHGLTGNLNRDLAHPPLYNASSCIEELKKMRPNSIESVQQEKFISEYSSHLWDLSPINENIKFPSIAYVSFSPSIDQNDKVTDSNFLGKTVIITEKMDGENCCLYNGLVFARTHAHEATHSSFAPIKQMYKQKIMPLNEVFSIPQNYMLFGENMTGIHSIEYDKLENYFYLFSVYDLIKHVWLEWAKVEEIACAIDVPTVPLVFKGIVKTDQELKKIMNTHDTLVSKCSSSVGPEGFVIRYAEAFVNTKFSMNIAKCVRKNHSQTDETWRRTWKKAVLVNIGSKDNETINDTNVLEVSNKIKIKRVLPKLIILCGLPGSGKSSFAKALSANNNQWTIISQDDMGSRNKCEEEFSRAIKSSKNIIIDRCNPTKIDRYQWFQLGMNPSKSMVVFFNIKKEVCIPRVKSRSDHKTIPIGHGDTIVETFSKILEEPSPTENIGEVKTVATIEETNDLLHYLGGGNLLMDNTLLKFPRTPHLFDAREFNPKCSCAVTRDDLLMGPKDRKEFLNTPIVLQEKIDGANMGLSLSSDMKILAQNRSHYVTSSTHTQFKKLDEWIDAHYEDLVKILDKGRYVLYGEWCYAKHGIYYASLPNYFIAFDLFDRYHGKFLSTQRFFAKLAQAPSIVHVPLLTLSTFVSLEEINAFLTKKSEFTDGNIEGIYIRKEDNDYLLGRCKVIAPSFMESFDKHWTRKEFTRNSVVM